MTEHVVAREGIPEAGTPDTGRRLGHIEYKWIALGVVLLGTIMTILDSTIVNIAIKSLQDDFHVRTYSSVAGVVTGYLLAQGAVIPMSGWATDRWGTKRIYLGTILLFTLASAAVQGSSSTAALPPGTMGDFVRSYANDTLSIAFDRTFALIALISFAGIVPALYLRRPEARSTKTSLAAEMAA